MLYDAGFHRMPLADLQDPAMHYAGRGEVGTWAYRDGLLVPRQTHIMMFTPAQPPSLRARARAGR
jgi:hypothetical protein